jgi:hypothetical protein
VCSRQWRTSTPSLPLLSRQVSRSCCNNPVSASFNQPWSLQHNAVPQHTQCSTRHMEGRLTDGLLMGRANHVGGASSCPCVTLGCTTPTGAAGHEPSEPEGD